MRASDARPTAGVDAPETAHRAISRRQLLVLFASIFVIATNGVIYELVIAGYSSYLLGNSVLQFSLTIGVFLFSMGVGSYLTRFVGGNLLGAFVWVEIGIALVGGPAILGLYAAYQLELAYAAVMLVITGAIGVLIGFEIPIVARIAAERGPFRQAIADVLSLDYLGALIGSLAFPLLLLPTLGFTRTSFAVGLLNLAVAAATLWAFRQQVRRPWVLAIGLALVAAVLGSGLALTPWLRELLGAG